MAPPTSFATYPSLRDRVVVISGGASGIGEAIVDAFVHQGAHVVFLDIDDQAADLLIRRLAPDAPNAPTYFRCDLTDIAQIAQTSELILDRFPTPHILVNNAADDTRHTIAETTSSSWDQSIAVNLKHQFFLSQALIPAMRRAGAGSIINMSSIAWTIPARGLPVYVTAKAAIVGLTRALAHELGPDNIRVNCILPGAVLTEKQKRLWLTEAYTAEVLGNQALKRMILPEEVARLVLFLASDDSAAITNQSYVIDAGWT